MEAAGAKKKKTAKAVAEKVVVSESSDGFSLLNFQDSEDHFFVLLGLKVGTRKKNREDRAKSFSRERSRKTNDLYVILASG